MSTAERCACATAAGCLSELVTTPFAVLIVRLQLQPGAGRQQRSALALLRATLASEGPSVFYAGAAPALCRTALISGIGVGLYPHLRSAICGEAREPRLWQRFVAGAGCGCLGQFVASPFDVIKVRMQSANSSGSFATEIRRIARRQGVRGYFQGASLGCVRQMIGFGSSMAMYDNTKSLLLGRGLSDGMTTHACCSTVSGAVHGCLSSPFDVIKTRIVADRLRNQPLYAGAVHCLRSTVGREGALALWRGLGPTWMRLAPFHTLFFVSYEQASIALTGKPMPTR